MKKTLISHFYNEAYLLPWWLKHHKEYFDHGIMIDYHSTDNSRKIIERICPNWEIITTRNKKFEAVSVDAEVMDIESSVESWKITLNTTEFLVSTKKDWDSKLVFESHKQIMIPCHVMLDTELDNKLKYTIPLHEQKNKGINIHTKSKFTHLRSSRSMHSCKVNYSWGRHFSGYSTAPEFVKKFEDNTTSTIFNILWFGFSPYNDELLKRKLQIQYVSVYNGLGTQHFTTKEKLDEEYKKLLEFSGKMTFLENQNILSFKGK